jgi:hypothetical protein
VRFHGPWRQHRGIGLQLAQPGVLVGREDGKWLAALGQYFVAFEHHLVLERAQLAAGRAQAGGNGGVARAGCRFVVVVGKHGLAVQFGGQRRYCRFGKVVPHQQVSAGAFELSRKRRQGVVQEFDAAVGRRQRVQDGAVENEGTVDCPGRGQRLVQGGVIE